MDFAVLTELKNTVSSYQPLIDFAQAEFGKDFKHFIGNRYKSNTNAEDYPYFSYYPQHGEFLQDTNIELKETSTVAVQYAVRNNDVEKATKQILEIKELLIECLKQNHRLNGLVLNLQPERFVTDEGYYQPYFFARLSIKLEEIK